MFNALKQKKIDKQYRLLIERPIPKHIGIILDGNGRWAKKRGLPRIMGHAQGIKRIKNIIPEVKKLGVEVEILSYDGEIWGITLPAKVTLKVVESAPAVRGDTSKNALKDAVLETGLKTKVQLFVEEGDEIIVSTEDGSYVSRA